MAQLFGKEWTKKDLSRRMGRLSQVGGVREFVFTDGAANGMRAAEVKTGSGLNFTILLDRAMDIGAADFAGYPLNWESGVGYVHPAYFRHGGTQWLRTFGGGLLTTCGLSNVGAPNVDEGKEYSLHGVITALPAENVRIEQCWKGEDLEMSVSGTMRETSVFGPDLCMDRLIWTRLGEKKIFIEDCITNNGEKDTPLMFLYHINIGWPIVDEGTLFILPSKKMTPRDAESESDKENFDTFQSPQKDFKEKVFSHEMIADSAGYVPIAVVNPNLRNMCFGIYIKYTRQEMPRFTQWKMLGEGTYVLGLEPGNCSVLGRAEERKRGTLQIIQPGESKTFHLEIGIINTPEELNQISDLINNL